MSTLSNDDLEDGELPSSDDEEKGVKNIAACGNEVIGSLKGDSMATSADATVEEFPMLESAETSRKRPFESPEPPELQKDTTDAEAKSPAKVGILCSVVCYLIL